MTLDASSLDDALASLDASLRALPAADWDAALAAEVRRRSSELTTSLRLPNLTVDVGQLDGIQAAMDLFARIKGFPEEMMETQSEVISRVSAFDAAVGQVSKMREACDEMLELREAMLVELRGGVGSLITQLGDDIESLVSDAGESLTESFEEQLAADGAQVFSDVEQLLDDAFADFRDLAADSAQKLESAARNVAGGFEEKGKALMKDVVEARARELVERYLADVIEDLALSQTIAMATQQINTAIASAGPNIVVALKTVGAVKRLLELAKL